MSPAKQEPGPPRCCGILMSYHEVFGIRVYMCYMRSHHSRIYENLYTGAITREEELEWKTPATDEMEL